MSWSPIVAVYCYTKTVTMESLAALSVACNIMEIIEFGKETVSICKRLYEEKLPVPYLDRNTKALRKASEDLKISIATASPTKTQPHDISEKIIDLTDELKKQIDKYKTLPGSSKASAFSKGLQYQLHRKRKIHDLSDSMSKLQSIMETKILVDLRYINLSAKPLEVLECLGSCSS